ncbi:glycosyltransferase family A protein [Algoriphagus sp. D3-2-R+10]|uniref:glycosyltransferase family 2 protein n=1 Tax=Algoriphagus aurantiacus TaxID=3103948 RepID=UPI002B36C344|nr:glycosyltransferase family A protein [Algoriphagus sp. D3-2-R+10]MEB2777520.1 glycosyltransferase family A protein [Algoriphagus sp. D3-2-R+10]
MIVICHSNGKVTDVSNFRSNLNLNLENLNKSLSSVVFNYSSLFPSETIVWCEVEFKELINLEYIYENLEASNILLSYSVSGKYILDSRIQFIDTTFFSSPCRNTKSTTYIMSSEVGCVSAIVLNNYKYLHNSSKDDDFDFILCSISKVFHPSGLFSYSEPKLVNCKGRITKVNLGDIYVVFKFVSQHWKRKWIVFLFISLLLKEKNFFILPLIVSFFYKRKLNNIINIFPLRNVENRNNNNHSFKSVDVIIPTIGRKDYVERFLSDLSYQILLPKNVIIIEQNPVLNSNSELDFLNSQIYPFNIIHRFIHKTGACNARNIGLELVESEWVFLADDDISIAKTFFDNFFKNPILRSDRAFSFSCLKPNEIKKFSIPIQWDTFGGGCSIIPSSILSKVKFDTKFEFGFGEDSDFGMQIRKLGVDIIYLPVPEIVHFKAPIGGFRYKREFLWDGEPLTPKPSPTVFLFFLKHKTNIQLYSFKFFLFLGYYRNQSVRNPIKYYFQFKKQWILSQKYALKLMDQ